MKPVTRFFIALLFSNLLLLPIYSQKSICLNTGAGFPELFNLGLSYKTNQVNFGLSTGWSTSGALRSYSGDLMIPLSNDSLRSNKNFWYTRWNFTSIKYTDEYEITKTDVFSSRIGREFNISNYFGIDLDLGLALKLSERTTEIKSRPAPIVDIDLNLGLFNLFLPSVGIRAFYKLH